MAYRDREGRERFGGYSYTIIEVRMAPRCKDGEECRHLTVDSDRETISYVEEHLEDFIAIITKLRRLEQRSFRNTRYCHDWPFLRAAPGGGT